MPLFNKNILYKPIPIVFILAFFDYIFVKAPILVKHKAFEGILNE